MRTSARTLLSALWGTLIVVSIVSAGCDGVTVVFGGGQPYGGYYEDFYYDYGPYSYYDGYWYYDDYQYAYDDYFFVDYVDGWYYDGYYDCYYCKSQDDVDMTALKKPASWDARLGPWERFVRARVEFHLAERAHQDASDPNVSPSGG